MIAFDKWTLDNGLKVLLNTDTTTPLVSIAIIYDVGSKDEDSLHTGYAHLFEHLMFGGSINIPDYDKALQLAGGSNNAYTTNDLTCYYCTLPASNIETAFWLESDRMLSLAFTPKSLEVQRSVVIEEFKEHYLNAPYGDLYHLIHALNYTEHPYRWPTIGLDIQQIEQATMADIRAFFARNYFPANAILAISGNLSLAHAHELCDKWFAPIPKKQKIARNLPKEPERRKYYRQEVHREVPNNLLYLSFPMPGRRDRSYVYYDLLTDILSLGRGGRLTAELVRKRPIFTSLDASVAGTIETGLVEFVGMVADGIDMQQAEDALWTELEKLHQIAPDELQRVKNLYQTDALHQEVKTARRAELLAEYELYGDANALNMRIEERERVTTQDLENLALQTFKHEQCRALYYRSK